MSCKSLASMKDYLFEVQLLFAGGCTEVCCMSFEKVLYRLSSKLLSQDFRCGSHGNYEEHSR